MIHFLSSGFAKTQWNTVWWNAQHREQLSNISVSVMEPFLQTKAFEENLMLNKQMGASLWEDDCPFPAQPLYDPKTLHKQQPLSSQNPSHKYTHAALPRPFQLLLGPGWSGGEYCLSFHFLWFSQWILFPMKTYPSACMQILVFWNNLLGLHLPCFLNFTVISFLVEIFALLLWNRIQHKTL